MEHLTDPAGVAYLLRAVDGPTVRRTMLVSDRVKAAAVDQIHSEFPRRWLAPTIVKRLGQDGRGPYVDVGTNRTHTDPHPIDGNPLLVFFSRRAGRVIYARHVNHPGSDFTDYLRRILTVGAEAARGL